MTVYKDYYKDKAIGKKGFGIHSHQRKLVKAIKCNRIEGRGNASRIKSHIQSKKIQITTVSTKGKISPRRK